MAPSVPKVTAVVVSSASNWWDEVNNSALWQDWIFHILALLYGLVAAVALVIFQPFLSLSLPPSNSFLFFWILSLISLPRPGVSFD